MAAVSDRPPTRGPSTPPHVRAMRVIFWSAVLLLVVLVAGVVLAFLGWLVVVDWSVLGL